MRAEYYAREKQRHDGLVDDAFHCVEALTFIRGSGVARFGIYSAVGLGFA